MALTQAVYRFGTDTGTNETDHGWAAAQNTGICVGGAGIALDTPFLLRFGYQNDATAASNINFTVQYKINAGSWVTITTSTAGVKAVACNVLTNNGNTTQRLTGLSGTFQGATGQAEDGDAGGNSMDIASNGNAEAVFSIQVNSAGVTAGDTITFQSLQEGSALAAYSVTPTLTVAKTLAPPAIASTVALLAGAITVGAVTLVGAAMASGSATYAPNAGTLAVVLSEGATTRATRYVSLTSSLATTELALTTDERNAISDWSALRLSVTANGAQTEVSWAELETPAGEAGASPQTLSPPAVAAGTTLLAPTVAPGAVILAPPLYSNTTTKYAPTLALTLAAPLYSNTSTKYAPALALNLTAPLLTNTSTLRAPTVLNALALPAWTPSTALTAPTVLNALALPTIASTVALLEGAIDQGGAPAQTLYPPAIAAEPTLLPGAITTGAVTLEPPLYSNTSTLYEPTVAPGAVTLLPPVIANTSTLYAGEVTQGAVTLQPPSITNSSTLTAPTVLNALALPAISNTSTLAAPTVPKVVVVLSEGATTRATRDVGVTDTLATYALALTTDERNAISDWSTLRLSWTADGTQIEVSWAELETPAATAAPPQALELPTITNTSTLYEGGLVVVPTLFPPAIASTAGLTPPSLATPGCSVELREGATVIASWVVGLATDFTTFTLDLTTGQRNAITDWSALQIAVIADGIQTSVSWLEFQIPAQAPLEGATIANISSLYAPSAGQTTVTLEMLVRIPAGSETFSPSLATGAVTLELPTIDATSTLYPPTVVSPSATLDGATIANTSTLYEPTVTQPAVTLTGATITNTSDLYPPSLAVGAVTLLPPLIASESATYLISVAAATVRLSMTEEWAPRTVLSAPTVLPGPVALDVPHQASTAAVFPPSLAVGAVTLELPTISAGTVLYGATILLTGELGGAIIPAETLLYSPSLTVGAVTLEPPSMASTATLTEPAVELSAVTISLPLIASTAHVYEPRMAEMALPHPSCTLRPLAECRTLRPAAERRTILAAAECRTLGATDADEPA